MPYPYDPYNIYGQRPGYQYGNPYQQPQQQQQQNTYAFVNGVEGAKSYPMGPNQTVMLMDSDQPLAYMKQSNGMGQATLKYFRLVETSEDEIRGAAKPSVEYATKAEFDKLSERVAELLAKKGE